MKHSGDPPRLRAGIELVLAIDEFVPRVPRRRGGRSGQR